MPKAYTHYIKGKTMLGFDYTFYGGTKQDRRIGQNYSVA